MCVLRMCGVCMCYSISAFSTLSVILTGPVEFMGGKYKDATDTINVYTYIIHTQMIILYNAYD